MAEVPVNLPSGTAAPKGLLDAFWEYERVLMINGLEALDRLFAPGPDTLRGDATGLLVGHDAISAFRKGRGGSPARTVVAVEVRPITTDAALVVAITAPAAGGRGQQTQLWRRGERGWVVEVAHVSLPTPAIAATTWRLVGTPLVPGASVGPLAGHRIAVKDLFEVAGHPVGAGIPAYLAEAPSAREHAPALAALLDAGASVQGIAQTDEFAYSIAGKNPHYGTPPNPAMVGGIPGGSSSGPASAVAQGQATIGLATDTAGSIRVPASYQGLWGIRTTHGAVSVERLLPLAPSFDTVGWLTRDAATLRAAASVSLDPTMQLPVGARFAVAPTVSSQAEDDVREAFDVALADLTDAGVLADAVAVELGDIDDLFGTFRTVQAAEAWRTHGAWVTAHPGAIGAEIAARFAFAATITPAAEATAREALAAAEMHVSAVLGDRILLLPSASSAAPSASAASDVMESIRASTLRMTCIAGIARRPALSVPMLGVAVASGPLPAPVGLCLVGPRFSDLALIDVGERLASALKRV
ncbi:MAG: AtzH-like domain-containing protein [Lacisediminihabitans sp.]